MRAALNAVLALALSVSALVPCGPHVLAHALELAHHHDHDGAAHDHDGDHHGHEFQPSPEGARIASSGVRLPAPALSSFPVVLPDLAGGIAAAPALAARALDPPDVTSSPQSAARCYGNRAPPAA